MKYHNPYILSIAFITTLVSCVNDNFTTTFGNNDGNVDVEINTRAGDVNSLGTGEDIIKSVRLYAFDGNALDNMVFVDNINGDGIARVKMKVTPAAGKTLIAVVNEPENSLLALSRITSPTELDNIQYAMANYFSNSGAMVIAYNNTADYSSNAFFLPMYGSKNGVNVPATATKDNPLSVGMTVNRSLARIDVYLQKDPTITSSVTISPSTKLGIINTLEGGYVSLTNSPTVSSTTLKSYSAVASANSISIPSANATNYTANAKRCFSFYVPERTCGTGSFLGFTLNNINVDGTTKSYTCTLGNDVNNSGDAVLTKIERNKIYKFYGTVRPWNVTFNLHIVPWNTVDVLGVIYGSYIKVDKSKVVMDYATLGETFSSSVSFKSDGTVTLYGFYDRSGAKISQPNWLSVANLNYSSGDSIGNLMLTYQPYGKIWNVRDQDTIFVRLATGVNEVNKEKQGSGNILKDVEVIYDNGFIPYSEIFANEASPTSVDAELKVGMQMAKRGNVLPTETPLSQDPTMVWSTDVTSTINDIPINSGKGKSNTSYLKNIMGSAAVAANNASSLDVNSNWFLPTANEVYTFLENSWFGHKGLFGASYRVNNSELMGFWTSSFDASSNLVWRVLINLASSTSYVVSNDSQGNDYINLYTRSYCATHPLFIRSARYY